MTKRAITFAASAVGLASLAAATLWKGSERLVYNGSRSVPVGWYIIEQRPVYERGNLVLIEPPTSFARLIERRGYLPPDVPLIKRIAAVGGDHACFERGRLTLSGDGFETIVSPRSIDRSGWLMPHWNGCRELAADEVFVLLTDTDRSLDGRYFGPVPAASIRGEVRPLFGS